MIKVSKRLQNTGNKYTYNFKKVSPQHLFIRIEVRLINVEFKQFS